MSAHAYGLSLLRRGPVPRLVSIMAAVILAAVGAQTAPVAAPGHADSRAYCPGCRGCWQRGVPFGGRWARRCERGLLAAIVSPGVRT
jgi:hypothetical protein